MEKSKIAYFNFRKNKKNPIFFDRFSEIQFNDLKILDLGCGHGALSIDLVFKGAYEVMGIDLNEELISFANENLENNYPDLIQKITFKAVDLKDLDNDYFDMIISMASFEHIIDLDILLIEMKKKLKMGGRIITGFGPLYNSPWGDHNRLKHKLPWSHIILGQQYFIKRLNKSRKKKVNNIFDLGLNGYSLKKYKHVFNNTEGLTIVDFRTNQSSKTAMKIFDLFTFLPFLREYFTYNIYSVLQRSSIIREK